MDGNGDFQPYNQILMDGNGDFQPFFHGNDLLHHPIETLPLKSGCLVFQV